MSPAPVQVPEPLHVIFDDSALIAAGHGNVLASTLIAKAHPHPDPAPGQAPGQAPENVHLYVAACALVAADRERPGTGRHFTGLPNVVVIPLDLFAALDIMTMDGWSLPHTRWAAQPSLEVPEGAIVATARPDLWRGQPVRVLDLTP